jgi:hypothetical protein
MFLVLSVIFGLIGLGSFLSGLLIGLLELWDVVPTIGIVLFGITFMFLSAVIWLRMLPGRLLYALQASKSGDAVRNLRQRPLGIVGILDLNMMQSPNHCVSLKINPESTETLLKSIRGATYLIQVNNKTYLIDYFRVLGYSVQLRNKYNVRNGTVCYWLLCYTHRSRLYNARV